MKISMISLGCDKNLVDAEHMLGTMAQKGYSFTDDETQADVIVVNTCCFIEDAKQESINTIIDTARLKEEGNLKVLIVAGCLAQRYKDEILEEIPEVDALIGTSSFDKIEEAVENALRGEKAMEFLDLDRLPKISTKRLNSTGGWYAYLKIAEGCDKNCTYCIIPSLRGHYRSYPMEELVEAATQLASEGVKELILVAQETTLYGVDLYQKKMLPELLKRLCGIEGIRWIRILYCYPEEITDELIDTIASEEKICHYLDIPIQHASDRILRRMARRTNQNDLKEIVGKLRKKIPDIILRTTLITGFPGFENQVDEEVKEARREEIMLLQQEISLAHLQSLIGEELDVVIEGNIPDDGVYIGRTYMDVPGVDGYVFVESDRNHMSGDFVRVKITGASEYDLMGELV